MQVSRRLRLLWIAVLLHAAPAAATPITFAIDPAQSTVSLSGAVSVDFGLPGGPVVIPLGSQIGLAGVSGDVLPNGVLSDGLITSLGGSIEADLDPGAGTLAVLAGSTATPGISGTWLPGHPDLATPTPGQVAAAFADASLGISGTGALRELELVFSASVLSLTPLGGGVFAPAPGSTGVWTVGAGFLDQSINLGAPGRIALEPVFSVADLSGATLTSLGGGGYRLELPVDLAISLDADDFGIAFPLFLDLDVEGTLVATGSQIPEPATGALLALGVALLAANGRGRRAA